MMALSEALQIHLLDLCNRHDLGTVVKSRHGHSAVVIVRVDSGGPLLLLLLSLFLFLFLLLLLALVLWALGLRQSWRRVTLSLGRIERGRNLGSCGLVLVAAHRVTSTIDQFFRDRRQVRRRP